MAGWIKIDRKIQEHWIWKDPVKLKWWLDILMTVNYEDNKVAIGYKIFDCKRGESLMSLKSWADRWGVSKSVVNNFFNMLKNDNMVVLKSETVTIRITVCNYDSYQQVENASETQEKRKRNARETHRERDTYTIKEREEREERKEGKEEEKKTAKAVKENAVMTWRDDFQIYLSELRVAYNQLIHDPDWMAEKQKFHPGVNIKLSLEKACVEFWATEAGWKNKKALKTKIIDWKATLTNAISLKSNKVYESKPAANNNRKELENLRELSERVLQEFTSNNNP